MFLSCGTGFVREFNHASAAQSGNSVQEPVQNKPKLVEPRLTFVYQPNGYQIQHQISNRPVISGSLTTPVQSIVVDQRFMKHALVDSTNANGLKNASGNTSTVGKIKQIKPKTQCQYCNKAFTSLTNLLRHQEFHCNPQMKRPFHCKHCEKLYMSLGALKMHIRTHTLPCKCKICGKAFSRPWLLQGHIRTHTGERPYKCTQCQRAFADRSNLRAHMQTHSDVKRYSCTRCSKSFSRMSLLHKHEESCQVFSQHSNKLS